MFLTRKQYDSLIEYAPNWVELRWNEYSKRWSLGGVHVSGSTSAIENLRCQLAIINTL